MGILRYCPKIKGGGGSLCPNFLVENKITNKYTIFYFSKTKNNWGVTKSEKNIVTPESDKA